MTDRKLLRQFNEADGDYDRSKSMTKHIIFKVNKTKTVNENLVNQLAAAEAKGARPTEAGDRATP